MDAYDVRRLALVLAVQAEIEGMKATNTQSVECNGENIHWSEDHFIGKANELRDIAASHNDQL